MRTQEGQRREEGRGGGRGEKPEKDGAAGAGSAEVGKSAGKVHKVRARVQPEGPRKVRAQGPRTKSRHKVRSGSTLRVHQKSIQKSAKSAPNRKGPFS